MLEIHLSALQKVHLGLQRLHGAGSKGTALRQLLLQLGLARAQLGQLLALGLKVAQILLKAFEHHLIPC